MSEPAGEQAAWLERRRDAYAAYGRLIERQRASAEKGDLEAVMAIGRERTAMEQRMARDVAPRGLTPSAPQGEHLRILSESAQNLLLHAVEQDRLLRETLVDLKETAKALMNDPSAPPAPEKAEPAPASVGEGLDILL